MVKTNKQSTHRPQFSLPREWFLPAGCVPKVPSPTSCHLQPYVALDVVEKAGDLHTAAVNPCVLRLCRPNCEGHISKGNIAVQVVPLRCSECHLAARSVQDFVAALRIGAGASAPAHVGDVLALHDLVGARQCHRLSNCSSNNSFRHRVCCQGRARRVKCCQPRMASLPTQHNE